MKQKKIKEEIFIVLKKTETHQRELARILKTSQTAVRRALIDLQKENIVDSKIVGKSKIYFIKKTLEADIFEAIVEYYKLFKNLEKPLIRKIYKEVKDKILNKKINFNTIIVLFGSYAKGTERENSDIDIYINSNSKKEKKEIQEIYSLIHLHLGHFDKENLLFEEIKKDHIILNNVEGWLNLVGKNEKTY